MSQIIIGSTERLSHLPKVTQLFRVRSQTQPDSKPLSSTLYQPCSSKSLLYRWGTLGRHSKALARGHPPASAEQQPLVQRRERFHHVRGTLYTTTRSFVTEANGSQSVDSGPAAAALSGNLFEMQALNKPLGDTEAGSSLKTTD